MTNLIEKHIGENSYHYNVYRRRKKGGGFRVITAPCSELKKTQREFADKFYEKVKKEFSHEVTGFMPGMSIKDNAKIHVNREWVINLDIKSFFPSTVEELVIWALNQSGMSNFQEKVLEENVQMLTLNGALPQGSPASPIIANYIGVYYIDPIVKEEVSGVLGDVGYSYSRYADDITFSFDSNGEIGREILRKLVDTIKGKLMNLSNYKIAENKIHVRHRSQRQLVTGIIVNEGFSITKEDRLKLRAAMHKVRCGEKELDNKLLGKLNFVREIKPELYNKLTGGNYECK